MTNLLNSIYSYHRYLCHTRTTAIRKGQNIPRGEAATGDLTPQKVSAVDTPPHPKIPGTTPDPGTTTAPEGERARIIIKIRGHHVDLRGKPTIRAAGMIKIAMTPNMTNQLSPVTVSPMKKIFWHVVGLHSV